LSSPATAWAPNYLLSTIMPDFGLNASTRILVLVLHLRRLFYTLSASFLLCWPRRCDRFLNLTKVHAFSSHALNLLVRYLSVGVGVGIDFRAWMFSPFLK
jgi:hypothetical protein